MTRFRENHPNVLKYVYRSHRAIDTQWGKVSHDCSKFSGAVATIEAQNPSGTSWEQRIEQAKVLFRMSIDPEEKEFKFFACWMILKDSPKWKVLSDANKKKKVTKKRKETAGQSSTPNDGGTQDVGEQEDSGDDPDILGTPERRTIMGTKKAKELGAAENRQQKGKEALAESTGKIAAAMNRRASILEEAQELQLVTMDTSSMTERQKQFFEKKMQLAEANLERKLKAANVESTRKEKENVAEGGLEESWEEYHAHFGQHTATEEPPSHLHSHYGIGEETQHESFVPSSQQEMEFRPDSSRDLFKFL